MVCRLLLNMHLNQKLRVRWETIHSEQFSVTNGVKQGGVISPILCCIYMDNLLHELAASGIGCYMVNVYAGAFGYADDLILLSPSVAALHKMSDICEKYTHRHSVKFNAQKSKLIVFKPNSVQTPDPYVVINGVKVDVADNFIYLNLGHKMTDNIYDAVVSKCVEDFNRQFNMFMADFKYAGSHLRNILFQRYCTSFYGTHIIPLWDDKMEMLCKSWRIAVRRLWRLPWKTHWSLLPLATYSRLYEPWAVVR